MQTALKWIGDKLWRAVRPTALPVWYINRKLVSPDMDYSLAMQTAINDLTPKLANITPAQHELVLIAVEHERQRIISLESKGFALSAFPSAVVALATLVFGHGIVSSILASTALVYLVLALASALQIVLPKPREAFSTTDATGSDGLSRLVATTEVNQPASWVLNNLINAAIYDTVRGAVMVIVAVCCLGLSHLISQRSTSPSKCTNSCSVTSPSADSPGQLIIITPPPAQP